MQLLRDRIIFLTGDSSGIGFECAKKYKLEGAKVVIMSNDEYLLQRSVAELGEEHGIALGDVSVSSDVEAAIYQGLNKYGKIDVIHNNAGIADSSKPLHEQPTMNGR